MKSEFLYQYNSKYGVPLRDRILANFETWCERFRWTGAMGRFVARNSYCSHAVKWILGIHPSRRLPDVKRESLRRWFRRRAAASNPWQHRPIMLFCDEFTNQIDVEVGQAAIELLEALGYEVKLTDNVESGRSAISLGKLDVARRLAEENVLRLTPVVQQQHPIVGIEPSALLTLRDEYPDLVRSEFTERAIQLSRSALTIDEFLVREMEGSKFDATFFRNESMAIRFHGHCHQKAISSCSPSVRVLSLPTGSQVEEIRSGCCGMAGFFGYDREKFALSMQIGELLLFPAIRQGADTAVVAATGTSCRQQILDATGITALHPVQILRKLLRAR